MPPTIALLLWVGFVVWIFIWDPARDRHTSPALWVPLLWMFIVASRLPSQWFGSEYSGNVFEEGNPLDRFIYTALIALAIGIMAVRTINWGSLMQKNLTLVVLLTFALVSVLWSDFTFVAFKRWFRDIGNYLMILVTLSDPRPVEAVRTLLRRLGYVLIPLCLVLTKYYPAIGMQYDRWSGVKYFVGATTSKNMLGVLCMISGLFFFWDTLVRWPDRKDRRTRRIIVMNLVFFALSVRELNLADSATSRVCMALGCLVIAAAHTRMVKRTPALLTTLIPLAICTNLILQFGLGIDLKAELAGTVGRDATLTGRTVIWDAVLRMHTNPLVGTGYESFWLGKRLIDVWTLTGPGINEAHNGYLELYLELGIFGVILLAVFLIACYRTIRRRFKPFSDFASFSLALWTIVLFYNMTESAMFRGQLMWNVFMLTAIVAPAPARRHPGPKRLSSKDRSTQREPVIA